MTPSRGLQRRLSTVGDKKPILLEIHQFSQRDHRGVPFCRVALHEEMKVHAVGQQVDDARVDGGGKCPKILLRMR
jgi:hypothetical protein